MSDISERLSAERIRTFFLFVLFLSIPFSIAGNDFAIIGLYLCTIYLLVTKKEHWISVKIHYAIGIMLLGAVLSTLASSDLLSGFSYFRSFWRFGLPFLIFLAFRNRRVYPYLRTALIVSCVIAVYSGVQFLTGLDLFRSSELQDSYVPNGKLWNAVGLFSHHLTYGGVSLVLFALFTPAVFDKTLSWSSRILFAAGSVCNLSAIVFSMGRSIWLGAIAALAMVILIRTRVKPLVLTACLLALLYAGYTQIDAQTKHSFFKQTTLGKRIESIGSKKANKDRLLMWQAAVNMVKDHPLLGLGPGNGEAKQVYYDDLAKRERHRFQHRAEVGFHNIYLQIWVDFGLLGLLGYLLWWAILLFQIFISLKSGPPATNGIDAYLRGLFSGFIGIMVAGIFENNFRDGEVQTAIFTAMGLALALIHQKRNPTNQSSD